MLHGYCRHPSKCDAPTEITGVETRRVVRQRGLAGPVRRTLIGNVGDGHAETGLVWILRTTRSATRRTNVSRLVILRDVSAVCEIKCWVDVMRSAL